MNSDSRISMAISFPEFPAPMSALWELLASYLDQYGCLPRKWMVLDPTANPDKYIPLADVTSAVDRIQTVIGRQRFTVMTFYPKGTEISFALSHSLHPATKEPDGFHLGLTYGKGTTVPPGWNGLIEAIMERFPSYGGRQWSTPYVAWQGCGEEDSYARFFGPVPKGFRRRQGPSLDGMTPGRILLDTSKNPGRFPSGPSNRFRAAPADLWLGPHFWDYAPCTKEEVLAADFFLEKRDTPHFLYLKSWPHPFTRPDGEQGRVQQKLWRLLFHEDCEWPPGSGGISDVPVGGPPELMP